VVDALESRIYQELLDRKSIHLLEKFKAASQVRVKKIFSTELSWQNLSAQLFIGY